MLGQKAETYTHTYYVTYKLYKVFNKYINVLYEHIANNDRYNTYHNKNLFDDMQCILLLEKSMRTISRDFFSSLSLSLFNTNYCIQEKIVNKKCIPRQKKKQASKKTLFYINYRTNYNNHFVYCAITER